MNSNREITNEAYFEHGVVNKLVDYFNKQKIGCIEVVDRVERLVPLTRGRSNVLELGCAYGQNVNALRKRGYPAYGCDISDYSIKEGQARLKTLVFQADIEDAGFVDRVKVETGYTEFDVVFSCITLEHMHPDKVDVVLENIRAVTKVGGYNYHAIDLDKGDDITHYCIMPRQWWIERFKEHGFIEQPVGIEGEQLNWFLFKKGE